MSQRSSVPSSPIRRALIVMGALSFVALSGRQFTALFHGGLNAPLDFAAFWAAGRLAVDGENPYSGDRLHDVQASVGLTSLAVIAWNPPWTLTLLMPFGSMPFRFAYGLWIVVHLTLIVASSILLWRAFDGPRRLAWIAPLVSLTFAPTFFLIGNAQLTAVVLFGLALFVFACRADRPILAGAGLSLVATKPHLVVLLGVWLALMAIRTPFGRRVLLGALVAGVVLCLPPAFAVPSVWGDYFSVLTGPADPRIRPLADWKPPLIGWWLRQSVPGQPFWIQWLPLLFATVTVAALSMRTRTRHSWEGTIASVPWLVALSLLVAPYGAWAYDLVLLLVLILAVVAQLARVPDRRAIAIGFVWLASVNVLSVILMINGVSSEWYVWLAPSLLLGAAAVGRLLAVPRTALQSMRV